MAPVRGAEKAGNSGYSAIHTILVSVFEGKSFGSQSHSNETIYIQCRFNNEILTTDPVPHTSSPIWDTELAWDIPHKQLSYLRSTRAPLKLLVYSLDTLTGQREVVGWIVLDLRAAQAGDVPLQKWYPLLAHGQTAFRPEVKIAFSVSPAKTKLDYLSPTASPSRTPVTLAGVARLKHESSPTAKKFTSSDAKHTVPSTTDAKAKHSVPTTTTDAKYESEKNDLLKTTSTSTKTLPVFSIPFYLTSDGYYNVGTSDDTDVLDITLWITIAFAQHLDSLLEDIPSSNTPSYRFYYSLMGTDITTQPFANLVDPNFPAERVSVHLKGARKDIATFLSEWAKLVLYFCKDSFVFGYADVGFDKLVALLLDFGKELAFPLVAEGVYPLSSDSKGKASDSKIKANASIGVSLAISLTKEAPLNDAVKGGIAIERNMADDDAVVKTDVLPIATQNSKESDSNLSPQLASPDTPSQPNPPLLGGHKVSFSDLKPSAPVELSGTEQHRIYADPKDRVRYVGGTSLDTEAEWHQFRFSIELRSIRSFKLKSANLFLKYSYPPFGTSAPYISHPVTQMTSNDLETLLPHSFCSFEFAMSPARFLAYLESVPLLIEVMHKDPSRKNILLGSCVVDLSQVGQTWHATGGIQSADFFSPISALGGAAAQKFTSIGELRTLLALEDFGPVETGGREEVVVPDIHDTLEYQTALELELWRQGQQEGFEEKMREKERALEAEYVLKMQSAQAEADDILNAKLAEYGLKISKLQDLSDQLQEREGAIQRAERDLSLEKANLEREAAAALHSQRDAARRLEESFAHSFSMLKQRAEDAEKKSEMSARERDSFRQRVLELEVKGQADNSGLGNRMEEVSKLTSQVLTLQSQNERLVSSRHDMKKKYKTLFRLYTTFKTTAEEQVKEIRALKDGNAQEAQRQIAIRKELASLDKENQEIKAIGRAVQDLKNRIEPGIGCGHEIHLGHDPHAETIRVVQQHGY